MAAAEVSTGRFHRGAHGGLHLVSLLLSVALWGLVVVTALCSSDAMPGQVAVPATFLALVVLAYAMEVALCSTRRYLNSITEAEDAVSFVKRLKLTPPEVGFGIECSHLEERLETTTDDRWRTSTETGVSTAEAWRRSSFGLGSTNDMWRRFCGKEPLGAGPMVEEVATWRATEDFEYDSWKDETGYVDWLWNSRYTVVRLNVSKADRTGFMDADTERLYALRKKVFLEVHRSVDRRFNLYDYVDVAGFQQTVLALRSDEFRPWWLSLKAFYAASLLGLTWPYRQYLSFRSLEASICIRKAIHCEPL